MSFPVCLLNTPTSFALIAAWQEVLLLSVQTHSTLWKSPSHQWQPVFFLCFFFFLLLWHHGEPCVVICCLAVSHFIFISYLFTDNAVMLPWLPDTLFRLRLTENLTADSQSVSRIPPKCGTFLYLMSHMKHCLPWHLYCVVNLKKKNQCESVLRCFRFVIFLREDALHSSLLPQLSRLLHCCLLRPHLWQVKQTGDDSTLNLEHQTPAETSILPIHQSKRSIHQQ